MAEAQHTVQHIIARGMSAWERDDYASALGDFREVLRDHPNFPDIRNKAGLCLAMLGDMEGALDEFQKAVEINDDYAEAHLNRAIVLNELGRFDEARDAFARAGELDRKRPHAFPADLGNRIAVAHARLGDLYMEGERYPRAAEEFRNALEIRPTFLDIRSKLAEAYFEMGELHRARDELEGILEANPNFLGARLRLGSVLHRQGDDLGAVREWTRCAEQAPDDMRVRAYLASLGKSSEELEAEEGAGAGDPAVAPPDDEPAEAAEGAEEE